MTEKEELYLQKLMKKERENTFHEMVSQGKDYYIEDIELYCLHMSYRALIGFMLEEDFDKCALIKKSISDFMKTTKSPIKNAFEKISLMEKFMKNHGK